MSKLASKQKIKDLFFDGMTVMIGGFVFCGNPLKLIDLIVESNVKDITVICNDTGKYDQGIGKLIHTRQVKKVITSHIGLNAETGQQYSDGELELELCPQGSLAERVRCGGHGLGGVLTKTGLGTLAEQGKQVIESCGEQYVLETALRADIALISASVVDDFGNCIYKGTTKNFNPVMAMAAETVVVETEEVVDVGKLDPDCVMTSGICVDHIFDKRQGER